MNRTYKKIISAILPIPLFLAITFCCCLDEKASAEAHHFSTEHQTSHELEKSNHSEHQHSDNDHECTCPKHLSFLSGQTTDIVFDLSFSHMLAKNFMANIHPPNIVLLASLSNHAQGPPFKDQLDHASIPIYLKISNLRI